MAYPVLVLVFALGAVVFLLQFIVPLFVDIFKSIDGELPYLTQLVMQASSFLKDSAIWIILAVYLSVGIWFSIRTTEWYRRYFASFVLKVPVIGSLVKKLYLLRYYRSFSLLLSSDIGITPSLKLLQEMLPFYPIQKAIGRIHDGIVKGNFFSHVLKEESFFGTAEKSLTAVGEESNNLPTVFEQLADNYEQEAELQTELLGTIMEPILIVLVGLVVGIILIALYLPMFQLGSLMG